MAKKPKPPKPISWNVYNIASKAVLQGIIEALTNPPRWKEPRRIQGAGHEADGDAVMTRREGEITAVISTDVTLPAGKVEDLMSA
jgi:hypothetical protein